MKAYPASRRWTKNCPDGCGLLISFDGKNWLHSIW